MSARVECNDTGISINGPQSLRAICSKRVFLLEDLVVEPTQVPTPDNLVHVESSPAAIPATLREHHCLVEVGGFFLSLYGQKGFTKMKPYLPEDTLRGSINFSHIIKLHLKSAQNPSIDRRNNKSLPKLPGSALQYC